MVVLAACPSARPAAETTTTRSAAPATTPSPRTTVSTTTTGARASGCPVPARAAPDPARPRYGLHIEIRPATGVVAGDVGVSFTPELDTDRLVFRLWPNEPSLRARGASLSIGTVRLFGVPAHS